MLLHYSFSNYCSYQDTAEFDLLATKTKAKTRFPDNYVTLPCGENVLKTAVMVGENAGGKSNFINSLHFLKGLFLENKRVRAASRFVNRNKMKNVSEGKTDESKTVQEFSIEVVAEDDCIYQYHLVIDWIGIIAESLFYKEKIGQKFVCVFDNRRKEHTVNDGQLAITYETKLQRTSEQLKEAIENSLAGQNKMGLFIIRLALLNIEHTIPFVQWMNEKLFTESPIVNYDFIKTITQEDDDTRILRDERFLDIFRLVDYSISGIEIDEEKPFQKTLIIRKKKDGTEFSREILDDSSGVRSFLAWAVQIFRVVYEDKVVFADEMDGVLNPILADRVIAFIHGKKHRGQFVFTSHNVLHLNLDTFMKEQIYFATKDKETLDSQIYSLADFPEIRYDHAKIYEFYMKGILGGTAFE